MNPFANRQWEFAPTPDEQRLANYESCQRVCCLTAMLAMVSVAEHFAMKAADIVSLSAKSEWRAEYQILTDYTQFRDTLSAADRVRREVQRYDSMLGKFISKYTNLSPQGHDAGMDICNRMDVAQEVFHSDYENVRRVLYAKLKPLKCTDPNALYPLLYAFLMVNRFKAMARYMSTYAIGFRKGEGLSPLCHLQLQDAIYDLINRCRFYDKEGNRLLLMLVPEDRIQYQQDSQKRSWQLKHKGESLRPVYIDRIFQDDDVFHAVWSMEIRMLEIKVIDDIILRSEGVDPQYRKQFKIKRIQLCAELYEQVCLTHCIALEHVNELPERIAAYLAAHNAYASQMPLSARRPKPVVAMLLTPKLNKNGKPIVIKTREGNRVIPSFALEGIWNSISEAAREKDRTYTEIQRSLRKHEPDSRRLVWMKFDEWLIITYYTQLKYNPEVAARMLHVVPNLQQILDSDPLRRASEAYVEDSTTSVPPNLEDSATTSKNRLTHTPPSVHSCADITAPTKRVTMP